MGLKIKTRIPRCYLVYALAPEGFSASDANRRFNDFVADKDLPLAVFHDHFIGHPGGVALFAVSTPAERDALLETRHLQDQGEGDSTSPSDNRQQDTDNQEGPKTDDQELVEIISSSVNVVEITVQGLWPGVRYCEFTLPSLPNFAFRLSGFILTNAEQPITELTNSTVKAIVELYDSAMRYFGYR